MIARLIILSLCLSLSLYAHNHYQVEQINIKHAPEVNDLDFWLKLSKKNCQKDRTIQAFYTKDRIFIQLSIPSPKEALKHKQWQEVDKKITLSKERENELHLIISKVDSDLTFSDYWFWSSVRTHRYGYADDRRLEWQSKNTQKDSKTETETINAKAIADSGKAPYSYQSNSTLIPLRQESHKQQSASASRANVRVTGEWQHSTWKLLFSRKLNTLENDDIPFIVGGKYLLQIKNEQGKLDTLTTLTILPSQ